MIDHNAKLRAALDQAENYRGHAIRARDRGAPKVHERIAELYVSIAEELEKLV